MDGDPAPTILLSAVGPLPENSCSPEKRSATVQDTSLEWPLTHLQEPLMNFHSPSFRRTAVALFAALLPATVALAQDAERLKSMQDHAKERFTAADTDHDGMLTKAEAQKGMPFVAKHFDQIDTAKAGKLSLADITKFIEERRAKLNEAQKQKTEAKSESKTEK